MEQPTWVPPNPEPVTSDAPALRGDVLATFALGEERFRVWVANPATIQQLLDLRAGRGEASIPNGRILRGPGAAAHNQPHPWHLDPHDVELAENAIELCDGTPSWVDENVDEFVDVVGRFCPWHARLVDLQDLRMGEG